MGGAIVRDLIRSGFSVTLTDADEAAGTRVARKLGARFVPGDASKPATLRPLLNEADAAVSAVPYFLNYPLACEAVRAGCHFVDLGGNDAVVERTMTLDAEARRRGVCVVPDCGLAPGMASFLVAWGLKRFDRAERVRIRVGGLPVRPVPPLNYQLVFSIHGLLNEYSGWCRVLRGGRLSKVRAMTGLEIVEFPGVGTLEAFNTSGGASTMPLTFAGKVSSLDYKTLRYPGHCARMRDLMRAHSRDDLARRLERTVPRTGPEMTLVRIDIEGRAKGCDRAWRLTLRDTGGDGLTSMMRTTGFPAAIVAALAARGRTRRKGALRQERDFDPADFVREVWKRGFRMTETWV